MIKVKVSEEFGADTGYHYCRRTNQRYESQNTRLKTRRVLELLMDPFYQQPDRIPGLKSPTKLNL